MFLPYVPVKGAGFSCFLVLPGLLPEQRQRIRRVIFKYFAILLQMLFGQSPFRLHAFAAARLP